MAKMTNFQQRELSKKITANVVITIKNPPRHRALMWLGLRCMLLSYWLIGIGKVNVTFELSQK